MSHSPEPWQIIDGGLIGEGCLVDKDGNFIAGHSSDEGSFNLDDPNYERIVACVNACAGIPTDELLPLLILAKHEKFRLGLPASLHEHFQSAWMLQLEARGYTITAPEEQVAESDLKINLILWAMHAAARNETGVTTTVEEIVTAADCTSAQKADLRFYLKRAAEILNPQKEPK